MASRIPAIPAGNLAFPCHRHLKLSSPQMPVPDNETKAAIFPGEVIIVADASYLLSVEFPCRLGFSHGPPLSGGVGMGSILGCLLWKNQLARGWYVNNLGERYILRKICANLASTRRSGQKKRNLFGIEPGTEGPKTIF